MPNINVQYGYEVLKPNISSPNEGLYFAGYRASTLDNAIGPLTNLEKYGCVELLRYDNSICRTDFSLDQQNNTRSISVYDKEFGVHLYHNPYGPAKLCYAIKKGTHEIISREYCIAGVSITNLGDVLLVEDSQKLEVYRQLGFTIAGNYVVQYTKGKKK